MRLLGAKILPISERSLLCIPGNKEATIQFAAQHWVSAANAAILARGQFRVALSGGSTPQAIYQKLTSSYADQVDWERVHLFWSDERAVPPEHPDSNYHMAMEVGFANMGIPPSQIHRMVGEKDPQAGAQAYEQLLRQELGEEKFDLMMLGLGEDGHTASLFPGSTALQEESSWVKACYVEQKKSDRITLTFPALHQSETMTIYALGPSKAEILRRALLGSDTPPLPSQRLGTPSCPALWMADEAAASRLT